MLLQQTTISLYDIIKKTLLLTKHFLKYKNAAQFISILYVLSVIVGLF